MTIFGAMNAAVSGLAAQSQQLGMIADNIANVSTVGYKKVEARFSTLVTNNPTRSFHSPGGVRSTRFQDIGQQGLLQGSSSKTDVAVAGSGMFVVGENADGGTLGADFRFTRDGSFITDKEGNLVTSTGGYYLQGLPIADDGSYATASFSNLETISVAGLSVTARATTTMDIAANLPADDAVGTTHQISMPLFNAQGFQQNLDFFWTKTDTDSWALSAFPSDSVTSFASGDTSVATLDRDELANEDHFTFTSATGDHTGGVSSVTTAKTDSSTVTVTATIGGESFIATYTLPNALTDETNFTYAEATTTTTGAEVPAISGAYTGASATVTPGAPHTVTIDIGGTVYTATVPMVAGNDLTATSTLDFVNGADTLTLNVDTPYDFDVAGDVTQFQTDLNAALLGLTFNSGSIVDGATNLAAAGTLTLAAQGGQSIVLTNNGASASAYDLSTDADVATLQTNLQAALEGMVLYDNRVGMRLATATFDPRGALETLSSASDYASIDGDGRLNFYMDYDGLAATDVTEDREAITLNLGEVGTLDGLKQFAGDFFVATTRQNGVQFGNFAGLEISEEGVVSATFDNGERRDIYQLPLAMLPNFNGLEARDGNTFEETNVSGFAQLTVPGTAGAGLVAPSALELSTVDIAEEFTKMIVTQRAYSANAKIITTSDQMLEELIRIR